MKITKVTISNFLKLKDVEFNPSDANVIVGKNKQGKTSILKAIRAAFDGKIDETSIRIGEHKAEITIELDKYNVKRTITEKGNYLDISTDDGMKMTSPQKWLDGKLGSFNFNPIEFFDKKPAERKKYLLNAIKMTITAEELAKYTGALLTGIDYTKHALEVINDAYKHFYEKRTIANSEKTKKQKALSEILDTLPADAKSIEFSEERVKELRDKVTTSKVNAVAYENCKREISNKEAQIEILLKKVEEEKAALSELKDKFMTIVVEDTTSLEKELAELESKRDIVYTLKRSEELRKEFDVATHEANEIDVVVKRLGKEAPQELIEKAQLPVAGLTIDEDNILINGVNIDNLSSSEQLKFGLDIVRALNSEFKVICIDGIESLDKESFEFFLKEIENDDFQYFVTRVEGNSEHSIVVEDGEIKAIEN